MLSNGLLGFNVMLCCVLDDPLLYQFMGKVGGSKITFFCVLQESFNRGNFAAGNQTTNYDRKKNCPSGHWMSFSCDINGSMECRQHRV